MTDERKEQLLNIARWVLVGVFAYLYSEGGMHDLFIRRYIAPVVLGVGCFLLSWNWKYLVFMPLQMGTLCLGYGADDTVIKLLKRFMWGVFNGMSFGGAIIWESFYSAHLWSAVAFQMALAVLASVSLGVYNPTASARAEEFCIGVCLCIVPVMCAKRK